MITNQNLRVSWKNPQECVWKKLYRNVMRTTISQEKVTIHYSITIWNTNLFLCVKQWRYPQQKQQWVKSGKNLKRFRRGTKQKSETNLTWLMKQEKMEEKYTSLHWWTSVIWRLSNWRPSTKKTKAGLYSEATLWKMLLALIHWTRIICVTNDSSKSHGYHLQIAWLRWTSSGRSICLYRRKMEDAHKLLKIPKSECPDKWIRLPQHKWPKSWSSGPVLKTQSFLLSEICTVILWQDYFGKGKLRKSYCSTVGRMFPIGNAYSYTVKKGLFLSVHVDDIKLAGKKQNTWSDVENTYERRWFGRTDIIPGPCLFGLHSKTMWNKQRYCGQSQNRVWIANFRGGAEKLPFPQNLRISSWSYDMEGHAKKCVERYCELANKTTQQLYKVSTPCIDDHHFKEEELKSVGELSKVCCQNVMKCLLLARIGRPNIL